MDAAQIEATINKYRTVFPVPVGKIADELGISIISTEELPDDLSGSITKEDDSYFIYVAASHSQLRQRFTVAHEIGHFVKHREYLDESEEIKNPSKRVLNRPNGGPSAASGSTEQRYERDADQYAADLLMPESEFRKIWTESDKIEDVVEYFGVSSAAVNVRAYKLNLGYFE